MKTVLIYSGGLDSTTLLYSLLGECKHINDEIKCLTFFYGQRHRKEISHARRIATMAGVEMREIDLGSIRPLLSGSSQTDDSVQVPEGKYDEPNMKLTVVPNRNMIMLSVAMAYAISLNAQQVAYAAHGGDHAIYPDCRPAFVDAMNDVAALCDWHQIKISAPFLAWSKGDIAAYGSKIGAPLSLTWSCYKGQEVHCGKCGACTERKEAFTTAGMQDLTEYERS
jgi:7-cyano-7-deazaguanine synthase